MAGEVAVARGALALIAVIALLGCDKGDTVYRPSLDPATQSKPAQSEPVKDEPVKKRLAPRKVEKAGPLRLADFGLDIYPGATQDEKANMKFTYAPGEPVEWVVVYESSAPVSEIASFYRDNIKAEHALSSDTIAALDGTTPAGYAVRISIGRLDAKSTITYTITDKGK